MIHPVSFRSMDYEISKMRRARIALYKDLICQLLIGVSDIIHYLRDDEGGILIHLIRFPRWIFPTLNDSISKILRHYFTKVFCPEWSSTRDRLNRACIKNCIDYKTRKIEDKVSCPRIDSTSRLDLIIPDSRNSAVRKKLLSTQISPSKKLPFRAVTPHWFYVWWVMIFLLIRPRDSRLTGQCRRI